MIVSRKKKKTVKKNSVTNEFGIILPNKNISFKDLCEINPNLEKEVYDFIKKLPQKIDLEDAKQWLNETANLKIYDKPDTLENRINALWWHLKRLPVLGGSEIYDAISVFIGEKGYFNTPEKIFLQKRMKLAPEEPNEIMRRGTILEETIAKIMRIDYGFYTESEALEKVSFNSLNVPHYPFLGGNPDDIVKNQQTGKLILIDYKAPSEVPDKVSKSYVYQLHNYNLIYANGEENDLIEDMRIVFFNYKKGTVDIKKVPLDHLIIHNIKEYGAQFWKMVCDDSLSKFPSENFVEEEDEIHIYEMEDEDKKNLLKIEEKAIKIKALEDKVSALKKSLNKQLTREILVENEEQEGLKNYKEIINLTTIKETFKVQDEDGLKMALNIIYDGEKEKIEEELMKTTAYLDKDKLNAFLEENGFKLSLNDFMKKTLDVSKVMKKLNERGYSIFDYFDFDANITLRRTKKVKEILEKEENDAENLLLDFLVQKKEEANFDNKSEVKLPSL